MGRPSSKRTPKGSLASAKLRQIIESTNCLPKFPAQGGPTLPLAPQLRLPYPLSTAPPNPSPLLSPILPHPHSQDRPPLRDIRQPSEGRPQASRLISLSALLLVPEEYRQLSGYFAGSKLRGRDQGERAASTCAGKSDSLRRGSACSPSCSAPKGCSSSSCTKVLDEV